MKAVICFGIATAIGAGCKGGEPGAKAGAGSEAGPRPPDAAAITVPRIPKAVDPAAAEAVIAAWLDAQNRGAFDAYEPLYAARMEGVKRVGARATTFDRAGWLADRKRMFRHPMTVAARDLKVSTFLDSAAVDFVQIFTQGKFRDEGTKRIVLVSEAGGLRIAREEMLYSALLPSASGSLGAAGVRPVFALDGVPYVVLHDAAPLVWAGPGATLVLDDDLKLATRPAVELPAGLEALRGQTLRTFTADGTRCPARIGELVAIAGGTPRDETARAWSGDPATGAPPLDPAGRAEAVFGLGPRFLIGRLTPLATCTPVIAIDAGAPVFFAPLDPDPAVERTVVDSLRATPAYRAIQRRFVDDHDGTGTWLTVPEVRLFAGGGRRLAAVGGSAGAGCGGFAGAQWALFELTSGAPRLITVAEVGTYAPAALFDSDGDGTLEMIATQPVPGSFALYATIDRDGVWTQSLVSFPFLDDPC